jgi:hypothetical protein
MTFDMINISNYSRKLAVYLKNTLSVAISNLYFEQ